MPTARAPTRRYVPKRTSPIGGPEKDKGVEMDGNKNSTRMLVGLAAAVTFSTAMAAVVGIVPRVDGATSVRTAQAGATELAWMDREAQVLQEATLSEVVTDTSTTVVPDSAPQPENAPPTSAVAALDVVETELAPPTSAPTVAEAPSAPAEAAAPARRVPSPAEVQEAIQGMERFVTFKSGLFGLLADVPTPTSAQVDELGALVCTALDEGQTVEQAKATGLAMAADNPWVTITPAGAEYVVKTAITLYCPGHAAKLG